MWHSPNKSSYKTTGIRQIWEPIPALPLPGCVAVDLPLTLSEPHRLSAEGNEDARPPGHSRGLLFVLTGWGEAAGDPKAL